MAKTFVGDFYQNQYGFSLKVTENNFERVRSKLSEALEGLSVGSYINLNEISAEKRSETAEKFGRDIEQTASHTLSFSNGEASKKPETKTSGRVRKF